MRFNKQCVALSLSTLLLAACNHQDKNAPLAFVPADTPYVVANLEGLSNNTTRQALLTQIDNQLPIKVAQLEADADAQMKTDPDGARLIRAFAEEIKGRSLEKFADNIGLNIYGQAAFYGEGLSPVLRFELNNPQAFNAFIARIESAYGKKLDPADIDKQSYGRFILTDTNMQLIVAVINKQAIIAMLPANAPDTLVRETLGLKRPAISIADAGRLKKLVDNNGYLPWLIGQIELTRLLPLLSNGKDPYIANLLRLHAEDISAKTGVPVNELNKIPPSCEVEARRIAMRIPSISYGYTELDATHQTQRWDISLAKDIKQSLTNMQTSLSGFSTQASAPFEFSLALPLAKLRDFWFSQANAVAAKPFTCPMFNDLNSIFAESKQLLQQKHFLAIESLEGIYIAIDNVDTSPLGTITGRVLVKSSQPAALFSIAQGIQPDLAQLKLTNNGKPVALPNQPNDPYSSKGSAWFAMNSQALAFGMGSGEAEKLTKSLDAPGSEKGQWMRLHIDGTMYRKWTSNFSGHSAIDHLLKTQREQLDTINSQAYLNDQGLVITKQTILKKKP